MRILNFFGGLFEKKWVFSGYGSVVREKTRPQEEVGRADCPLLVLSFYLQRRRTMKRGFALWMVCLFLGVFPAPYVYPAAPVPLPADLKITPPDPKTPDAHFSGIWEGTLVTTTSPKAPKSVDDLCVVVEKIHSAGAVDLIYALRVSGKETLERVTGKLTEGKDEINFVLKSGAKVNLFYNASMNKIYVKYGRDRVYGDAVLSPRPQ